MRPVVLVVDDNTINQQLIAWALEDVADVHTLDDGRDCVAKVLELNPVYIFLDLMMPRVSGFDVLAQMQREAPEALKRTIVISAMVDKETISKAMAFGIAAFQKKPLEIEDILRLAAQL